LCNSLFIEKFTAAASKETLLSPGHKGFFIKGGLEMTNGEAKKLEVEVINIPADSGRENQAAVLVEETSTEIVAGKPSVRTDIQIRFARLKKSLRKRSASIL